MIKKLEVAGIHTDASEDIKKYIRKKIARLDGYMPKHARASAHAEVKLIESNAKDKKKCTAEVILHLPGEVISAKETTFNMYAAIDIVEEKLKTQLRRYKDQNSTLKSKHKNKVRAFFGKIVHKNSVV